jgi:hypothetical protein
MTEETGVQLAGGKWGCELTARDAALASLFLAIPSHLHPAPRSSLSLLPHGSRLSCVGLVGHFYDSRGPCLPFHPICEGLARRKGRREPGPVPKGFMGKQGPAEPACMASGRFSMHLHISPTPTWGRQVWY